MAMSDRAFRALAHAEPEVLLATLRVLVPRVVGEVPPTRPEDMGATRQDALPPPEDADSAMFLGEEEILHTEGQGYRDGGFLDRQLRYHLWFVQRYPKRRVRTVALWFIDPPLAQAQGVIVHGDLMLRVTPVVLPRVPAEVLVDDPRTACFAAGADRGPWSNEELCRRVAKALRVGQASWYQRHMAVIAAAMQGRYDPMVRAMEEQGIEPVIIEDLVKFGEDRGEARGEARGLSQGEALGLRAGLRAVFASRGLKLTAEQEARIDACADVPTLSRWLTKATTAKTVRAALA
jgi:hypothetical protein